ncbi:ATP-binding protein [Bosea sp. 685]|uniref:ATP-binding protein n=1 Tax=Bosea sp. 685 TaxID=3080057 RepID=UPI00289345F6|nr:ATP-binding protein [Bosea sp. 685]WNJ88649.1 ATP-binding protein [Bosea sp. 685]
MPAFSYSVFGVRRDVSTSIAISAFVGLVCLALIGHEAWRLSILRQEAFNDGRKDVENITRSVARQAETTIQLVDSILSTAADEYIEFRGDNSHSLEVSNFLRIFSKKMPQTQGFAIFDDKGKSVILTSKDLNIDISDRDYFKSHRDKSDVSLNIGAPIQSLLDSEWIIPVSRRLESYDGNFIGVAVAAIRVDFLQKFFDGFNIGSDGAILLASSDATLLARRPFSVANMGRDLSQGGIFKDLLPKGPIGTGEITSSTDGVSRINSYEKLSTYPLVIAVAASTSEIMRPWWENTRAGLIRTAALCCVTGLLGTLLAHKARDADRQRRLLFATLANMDDGLIVVGSDKHIEICNDRAVELLGLPAEFIRSRPTAQAVLDFQAARGEFAANSSDVDAALMPVLKDGIKSKYERSRPNGTVLEIRTKAFGVTGAIRTYRDITLQKKLEHELRENEALFRLLAENTSDVIVLVRNQDDKRIYASPSVRQLLGYSPDEFVTMRREDFVHADDADGLLKLRRSLGPSNPTVTSVHRLRHRDGRWIWVETAYTLLKADESECPNIIAVIRDVTERHQQQQELREARDGAEAAARAKSTFLASMSHELRTPLNSILGFARLLSQSAALRETPEARQAQIIVNASEMLLSIVNDVLDVSSIEANGIELDPRGFAPAEMVRATAELLMRQADDKGIELVVDCDPDLPGRVVGDDNRLKQILTNLIANAVKFTARGRVVISVFSTSEGDAVSTLHFGVTDTGIGIPADKMDRLFKRFSQVDSSTSRDYGGTGLGLAISQSLVELMGGSISVESQPGIGSTFSFAIDLPIDRSTQPVEATSPATALDAFQRSLHILLAEDIAMNQELAVHLLHSMGHTVDVVDNGASAVDAVSHTVYDVVLMDIRMPVMDGIEATKRIRGLPAEQSHVPIIALTANVLPEMEPVFEECGINAWICKPIDLDELRSSLTSATRTVMPHATPGRGDDKIERPLFDSAVFEKLAGMISRTTALRFMTMLKLELEQPFKMDPTQSLSLASRVHRLASTTGMLGFRALSETCRFAEPIVKNEQDPEQCLAELNVLRLAALSTIAQLGAIDPPDEIEVGSTTRIHVRSE